MFTLLAGNTQTLNSVFSETGIGWKPCAGLATFELLLSSKSLESFHAHKAQDQSRILGLPMAPFLLGFPSQLLAAQTSPISIFWQCRRKKCEFLNKVKPFCDPRTVYTDTRTCGRHRANDTWLWLSTGYSLFCLFSFSLQSIQITCFISNSTLNYFL